MRFPSIALLVASITSASAATIEYTAITQAAGVTSNPWIFGSTMWGGIEAGTSTATSINGFASLAGATPSLFSWTFGDLELTNFVSPTATTAGYEIYAEGDASVSPLKFWYDGELLATGTVFDIRVNVAHSFDAGSAGVGTGQITGAGANAAFYNEILSLTGGTGNLTFTVEDFYSVSQSGQFGNRGVLSFPSPAAVPESTSTGVCLALSLCFGLGLRIRRITKH